MATPSCSSEPSECAMATPSCSSEPAECAMATPSCSSEPTKCASSDTTDTTRICILHVDQQEKQKQADISLFKPEQSTSVVEAVS